MALKDWKKRKNVNYDVVFANDFLNQTLTIDNTQHGMFKVANKYYLEVFHIYPYRKILNRMFKSKLQALKFAKEYMRSH